MKDIAVHPHQGYLNTSFTVHPLSGTGKITVTRIDEDEKHGSDSAVVECAPGESIKFNRPGKYIFSMTNPHNNKAEAIEVKDAFRYGGSMYKNSFVFDEISWCFIVYHDRTYFYNRDSKEQYVENVSPDEIKLVNKDVVMFRNNYNGFMIESSLYSLKWQCPIIRFGEEEYICKDTLVAKHNDIIPSKLKNVRSKIKNRKTTIDLFKFGDCIERRASFRCTVDGFTISPENNTLYVLDNNYIYAVDMTTFEKKVLFEKGTMQSQGTRILGFTNKHYLIGVEGDKHGILRRVKLINLFDITKTTTIDPGFPIVQIEKRFTGKDVKKEKEKLQQNAPIYEYGIISEITIVNDDVYYVMKKASEEKNTDQKNYSIYYNNDSVIVGNLHGCITKVRKQGDLVCYGTEEETVVLYKGECKSKFRGVNLDWDLLSEKDYDSLITDGGWTSGLRPIRMNAVRRIGNTALFGENDIETPKGMRTTSETGQYCLTIEEDVKGDKIGLGHLIAADTKEAHYEIEHILSGLIDTSSYSGYEYLSDDGMYIRNGWKIINVETGETKKDDDNPPTKHRPLFWCKKLLKPSTSDSNWSNYEGKRFSDNLYACVTSRYVIPYDTNGKDPYDTNGKDISLEEYKKLHEQLDYDENLGSSVEKKKSIKKNRRKYIRKHFDLFYEITVNEPERMPTGMEIIGTIIYYYTTDCCKFTSIFIEEIEGGCVEIRRDKDDKPVERIIVKQLEKLNSVSFSDDSRYVAIGGETKANHGGLFLVYDLHKHQCILKVNTKKEVCKVAFNKDGYVAARTSNQKTYVTNVERSGRFYHTQYCDFDGELYEEWFFDTVDYRGFLTFSQDGKYMALSHQRYNFSLDSEETEGYWGHQPSTNVFIHSMEKGLPQVFPVISDLSAHGVEYTDKSEPVVSCSFSSDNRRLLIAGNDGVVVVINLHLK